MTTVEIKNRKGESKVISFEGDLKVLNDFKKGDYFTVTGLSGDKIIGIANGGFNQKGLPTICWVDGNKLVIADGLAFTKKGRIEVTDANAMEVCHLLTMIKNSGYEIDCWKMVKEKWRAVKNGWYLFVADNGTVVAAIDDMDEVSTQRHSIGNYFNQVTEQKLAEEIAKQQKQLYKR